jgi:hypothetical protein
MMTARGPSCGEAFDVSAANWLSARDKYYLIPKDGEPSDLNAVIQLLFPYTANNEIGCTIPDDGGGVNNDAIMTADVMFVCLAKNDPDGTEETAVSGLDRANVGLLFSAFPGIFGDQGNGDVGQCLKSTEEAGETAIIAPLHVACGHRTLSYDTTIWDNTNGLLIQNFFQEMFGKSTKTIDEKRKSYARQKINKGKVQLDL